MSLSRGQPSLQSARAGNIQCARSLIIVLVLRKARTTRLQKAARANADLFHGRGPYYGALSAAKLQVAKRLPKGLAAKPFDWIYS